MSRSSRYTIETKKRVHFSDFLHNFDKNPVTGYLAKAVDQQAIEISMYNLLMTTGGDWPFESGIGSKIQASLFDFNDPRMRAEIESSVAETITNHEPRVEFIKTIVNAMDNPTFVQISVVYSILNIPDESFQFDVVVSRVR